MFWSRQYDAFISYSHKDQAVVEPLVELLSLNERRVFWDHNLKAGDRWDQVLHSSVKQSDIFVLFWCCDSRESQYIAKEIALAMRLKKKIVPVKLCHAAMPEPLGGWQWIDLQKRVQHDCGTVDHDAPNKAFAIAPQAPRKTAFNVFLLSVAAGFMALLFVVLLESRKGYVPPSEPQMKGEAARSKNPAPDQDWDRIARELDRRVQMHERGPEKGPPALRIPAGAIPVTDGYIVLPDPNANRSGYILKIDPRGTLGSLYRIPIELPSVKRPDFLEMILPWWYADLSLLLGTGLAVAVMGGLAWIIASHRQRVRRTLGITMGYLDRLATG